MVLTTEFTEARVRGTLKAARKRPSGFSLACVHIPCADIFKEGNYRLRCVERRFYSPFRAAEGVSVSSVVKTSTKTPKNTKIVKPA